MWQRTLLAAEGAGDALRRGILNAIDVSIWNILMFFVRIVVIYAAFAAILYVLAQLVRSR